MNDDGIMEPGEALIEHEMRGFEQDSEMGNHAADEAIENACRQLNSDKWEKGSSLERIKLMNEFMDKHKSLHLDPMVISATMICTVLYGVQRQLKEIKHHLMGVSEED